MPAHPGERIVARVGSTEILLVTNESPEAERALAEQVARRAMRDTPFHTPAYTAGDDRRLRVFIAREARRARSGLAVLRPRPRWAWWSWDDWDAERRPATGVAPMTSWTVETIWAHPSCQSRGLARTDDRCGERTGGPADRRRSAGAALHALGRGLRAAAAARKGSGCRTRRGGSRRSDLAVTPNHASDDAVPAPSISPHARRPRPPGHILRRDLEQQPPLGEQRPVG